MGYNAGLNIAGLGINPPIDDPTGIASLRGVNDNDFIQRKSGLWVNRSVAQVRADLNSQETITTNADFSLLVGTNAERILYTGAQTANRAVTLSSLNAARGAKFHITHSGTGGYLLNIGTGPLKALRAGQWAEFIFDGTNWYLSNFGVLDIAPATEVVQAVTISGSTFADFTTGFATGFDEYIFTFADLYPNTSQALLTIQVSQDGGSSFYSASNYNSQRYYSAQVAGTPTWAMQLSYSTSVGYWTASGLISNNAGSGAAGQIRIIRNGNNVYMAGLMGGASELTPVTGSLIGFLSNPANAIRFGVSAGTYTFNGRIRMERVKYP